MEDFAKLKNKIYKAYKSTECVTFSRLLRSYPTLCSAYLSKVAYFPEDIIKLEMEDFGAINVIVRNNEGIQYYIAEFKNIVCVCFRGTVYEGNWKNIMVNFGVWKSDYHGNKVHWGYKQRIERIDDQLKEDINSFDVLCKDVLYTGHSKGGSLASIFSFNMPPDFLITFGSAKVSSYDVMKEQFQDSDHYIERVLTTFDVIPRLPPSIVPLPYFGRYGFYGKTTKKRFLAGPIKSHKTDTYIEVMLRDHI